MLSKIALFAQKFNALKLTTSNLLFIVRQTSLLSSSIANNERFCPIFAENCEKLFANRRRNFCDFRQKSTTDHDSCDNDEENLSKEFDDDSSSSISRSRDDSSFKVINNDVIDREDQSDFSGRDRSMTSRDNRNRWSRDDRTANQRYRDDDEEDDVIDRYRDGENDDEYGRYATTTMTSRDRRSNSAGSRDRRDRPSSRYFEDDVIDRYDERRSGSGYGSMTSSSTTTIDCDQGSRDVERSDQVKAGYDPIKKVKAIAQQYSNEPVPNKPQSNEKWPQVKRYLTHANALPVRKRQY